MGLATYFAMHLWRQGRERHLHRLLLAGHIGIHDGGL